MTASVTFPITVEVTCETCGEVDTGQYLLAPSLAPNTVVATAAAMARTRLADLGWQRVFGVDRCPRCRTTCVIPDCGIEVVRPLDSFDPEHAVRFATTDLPSAPAGWLSNDQFVLAVCDTPGHFEQAAAWFRSMFDADHRHGGAWRAGQRPNPAANT